MDELAGGAVLVARDGAGALEHRRIGQRGGRDRASAFPGGEIGLERRAEPLAKGALDEAHGAPALRAEAAVFGNGAAAGEAGRRIEQVERESAGLFQGAARRAEARSEPRVDGSSRNIAPV